MNSHLYHGPFEPGGLYAPQGHQCANEDVLRSDRIGVTVIATGDTQKILSTAIQRISPFTCGAVLRRVGRIVMDNENVSLFRFAADPVKHAAIQPRRDGFTKRFPSFATLHG